MPERLLGKPEMSVSWLWWHIGLGHRKNVPEGSMGDLYLLSEIHKHEHRQEGQSHYHIRKPLRS